MAQKVTRCCILTVAGSGFMAVLFILSNAGLPTSLSRCFQVTENMASGDRRKHHSV